MVAVGEGLEIARRDRQIDQADADIEREEIEIGAVLDDPLVGQIGRRRVADAALRHHVDAAGHQQRRRRGQGDVLVVVDAVGQVDGDLLQIVLLVVGAGILALAPLGHVAVVAHAHDRRPFDRGRPVAGVVAGRGGSVMGQVEVVAELVTGRLGDVVGAADPVQEHQAGQQIGVAETAVIGHAAAAAVVDGVAVLVGLAGDQDVPDIAVEQRRFLGRHIDVVGGEILGHAAPDVGHHVELARRPGRG